MENYQIFKKLGEGSYANVWQAVNKVTGEIVAIKFLKKSGCLMTVKECMKSREIASLVRMRNHPNIIKLQHLFLERRGCLCMVFELMQSNLQQVILNREGYLLSEGRIRHWCFQLFHALSYMHANGYFHRDLKPENLLLRGDIIKIADLGMVREIHSQPPFTEYITTRWYRAPEVILKFPDYNSAIDMWAMGAIMAELFMLNPLFPGSSELDEMYKICQVLGTPNRNSWPEGIRLAKALNFRFPQFDKVELSSLMPSASEDARNLIQLLCSWDPSKRPTAIEALKHPFFRTCYPIPRPIIHLGYSITRPSYGATTVEDSGLSGGATTVEDGHIQHCLGVHHPSISSSMQALAMFGFKVCLVFHTQFLDLIVYTN